MKRFNSLWLVSVVWGAALVASVALAYFTRPLVAVAVASAEPTVARNEALPILAPAPIDNVITIGAITIRGAFVPAVKPQAREEIHCTEFQDLSQGPAGSKVRYCE